MFRDIDKVGSWERYLIVDSVGVDERYLLANISKCVDDINI